MTRASAEPASSAFSDSARRTRIPRIGELVPLAQKLAALRNDIEHLGLNDGACTAETSRNEPAELGRALHQLARSLPHATQHPPRVASEQRSARRVDRPHALTTHIPGNTLGSWRRQSGNTIGSSARKTSREAGCKPENLRCSSVDSQPRTETRPPCAPNSTPASSSTMTTRCS